MKFYLDEYRVNYVAEVIQLYASWLYESCVQNKQLFSQNVQLSLYSIFIWLTGACVTCNL